MIANGGAALRRCLLAVLFLTLAPAGLAASVCFPGVTQLCLNGSRFQAEVSWAVPGLGSGAGRAVPLTGDTGAFWFFSDSNLELVVKVLDGRGLNRHFWVFYGGLSDVEYTLTVTDTRTGVQEVYHNPAGKLASASDVTAFDEEAPSPAAPARAAEVPGALPSRTGSELQVNVETLGMQWQPAVAMAPDGGYLVAWLGPHGVSGRLYDAAGNPRTGEILVAGSDTDFYGRWAPRVAASSKGGFLVVWSDVGGTRAKGRFVDANGQPLGSEVQFGVPFRSEGYPDAAADDAGNYLVVWLDGVPGQRSVHAQLFDGQGGSLGAEAALGATDFTPRVAASPLGGFLVTWIEQSSQTGALTSRVRAQRLDASAQSLGAALDVTSGALPGNIASALPLFYADGGFAVIWTRDEPPYSFTQTLFGRRFGPAGEPVAGPSQLWAGGLPELPDPGPAALALPTGETWILWGASGVPLDPDAGVVSGVFDRSWNLRGGLSRINTYTFEYQITPALAGRGGSAVAVWQSGVFPLPIDPEPPSWAAQGQDGSYFGIYGQRFTTSTCALDPSQLCLNGRFRVAGQFTDPRSGQGGTAQPVPLTSDTGAFWFFDASNFEVIVKVIDGRSVNGRFWVYAGALSDVAYTITVTDTLTGKSKVYRNPAGRLASRADTSAF